MNAMTAVRNAGAGTGRADPMEAWSARMDRLVRLIPIPLLVVSSILAWFTYRSGFGTGQRFEIALGLVAAAVVWNLVVTGPGRRGPTFDTVAFVGHSALAAALVWANPWFGIFAFTGYLLDERLPRANRAGLVVTALIMAGSQMAGYPTHLLTLGGYVIIAGVNIALALSMAGITDRMMVQNRERGLAIDELGETNRRLEQALAENAGLQEQLLAQAREAGVLDERQRLAGEIHDTLAQGLIGIITQLEAADQVAGAPGERERHLSQARALARTSLTEARRSMRALRPEQLEQAGLAEAIEELARTWTRTSGVSVRTETTGCPQPARPEVEAALFRVAQEALANVGKHAGASKVGLTLSYLDDVLLLDVRDDGTGFDPAARSDGFGLNGMRDRLTRVGGRLEIESAPGEGTSVNAAVPVLVVSGEAR